MSWKNTKQNSFADSLVVEHKSLSELDDVHNIINWDEIEQTLSNLYSSVRGAPSYPPLMMFKILILQAWYNLSDEALEKQIARDLMFRRFIDLSLSESVPDHSSIWRFRQLLNTEKLLEPLLEQINTHLEQNSIIVSLGSINIIDATVIEVKQCRKHKGKDGNNTQDPEANYNVKIAADGKKKTTYGFKMYANTDEDGFVKKMTYTPGNVHDSKEFDKLLDISKSKTCGQVFADSAYANKNNNEKLGKENNKILHRAYRNKPLTKEQKQENKQRSSIRYIVERTFGLLKLHHGLGKARYLGLERNKTRAQLIAISHNLKTGMNIFKRMRNLRDCCIQ
ncbi:IS5 family transposase [Bathymodiolus septemdierum thioautotrophic gill symbiont]|uniref:IS4 family transposase n=1 Tax=endosymbiont of Bathymodiolus septemdierum str. Myojin knoll TaxID=1303921 RepID=A0A0P0UQ80_9GAMM|nr:IS5 family transposase [Bathymodiolus septemdierum thioautotrophic gill symbiont]BAS67324.1 IS4 family transposase [endosymbiont of Bathymodiolus septemdierum str. Myojin knoll]